MLFSSEQRVGDFANMKQRSFEDRIAQNFAVMVGEKEYDLRSFEGLQNVPKPNGNYRENSEYPTLYIYSVIEQQRTLKTRSITSSL